jgi:hypothetical protein
MTTKETKKKDYFSLLKYQIRDGLDLVGMGIWLIIFIRVLGLTEPYSSAGVLISTAFILVYTIYVVPIIRKKTTYPTLGVFKPKVDIKEILTKSISWGLPMGIIMAIISKINQPGISLVFWTLVVSVSIIGTLYLAKKVGLKQLYVFSLYLFIAGGLVLILKKDYAEAGKTLGYFLGAGSIVLGIYNFVTFKNDISKSNKIDE